MTKRAWGLAAASLSLLLFAFPTRANDTMRIMSDGWSAADERGYGEFITAIGESGCRTVAQCIASPANPFRASDPPRFAFRADCADLPYFLRFDLTDILYHRHRETIASRPPDPEVVGQG